MMATYRVHAILVTAHGEDELPGGGQWGIVSDADLLRASDSYDVDSVKARTLAAQPVVTIASSEQLGRAAALMVDRDVSHLIVIESRSGRPLGVLSTLDVARALARFPEQHPGAH
jgi:CBS domain-containing protein